ncbi:MAG: Na+/H+ antiporter subunit E [Opitutales bacterium]|nr:Na+/H+ antiporter subunit E [Opitutales bacterium]
MTSRLRNPSRWKTEAASFSLRTVAFAVAWWILAEGKVADVVMPAAFILCAAASSRALCPPGVWRWKPIAVARFIPWFLWNSFLGGLDVALRALRPSMPLKPAIIDLDIKVSEKPALLLAWIASLLPGTACVYLRDNTMRIHVLDTRVSTVEKTRDLERRLGTLCE